MLASEIIGTVGIFMTLIVFIISFFKTRHAERMELIKANKTAKVFDANDTDSNSALKLGLLLLSIGLGLFIGLLIDYSLDSTPAAAFICILICGGISLIFYHSYVEKKNERREKENDHLV